jgi:hypothetical protein
MDELRLACTGRSASRAKPAARRVLWLAMSMLLPCGGQYAAPQSSQHTSHMASSDPDQGSSLDQIDPIRGEKRLRMLNAERQKAMISDTNKLLRLATELNAEVNSGNFGSLTSAQLKKVAEIEKLARRVKEEMSTSVRGTPPVKVFSPMPLFLPQ